MVGHDRDTLSSWILHFGTSLCGMRQFWQKQNSCLTATVDTLGLHTAFFTISVADLQWPELAHLLNVEKLLSSCARFTAVIENLCLADWFFYHRVVKFMDEFYMGIMGAKDYWLRFEYQHRGSLHVHEIVWLQDAPNIENIMETSILTSQQLLIQYIDRTVSTTNPSVSHDSSNISEAQPPQLTPDVCNQPYLQVEDYQQELNDLIAACQRHTGSYCLRTVNGVRQCCFNFPKPLQSQAVVRNEDDNNELTVNTARNDSLIYSHNPVQLSACRGNVDLQYCVFNHKLINYITKYATKFESRFQTMKEVLTSITRSLNDNSLALQVVQKLLNNSVVREISQLKKPATFYSYHL